MSMFISLSLYIYMYTRTHTHRYIYIYVHIAAIETCAPKPPKPCAPVATQVHSSAVNPAYQLAVAPNPTV